MKYWPLIAAISIIAAGILFDCGTNGTALACVVIAVVSFIAGPLWSDLINK